MNKLQLKDWILSIQHVLAMTGATVLVPLLTGMSPAMALLGAGLGTLLFHFITKKEVPVFLGSSFAFIAPICVIMEQFGMQYVQGGIIAVGLIYALVAFIISKIGSDKITKILPPHVVGAMIIIIGLNLVPSAWANIQTHMLIAFITLAVSLCVSFLGKGFIKQLGVLLGVVIGFLGAIWLGLVDFSLIQNASFFAIPAFTLPKFSVGALMVIVPVAICTLMEHVGDITTNSTIVGKDFIKEPGLHRTILGDGLATALAGLIGAPPNTTYGENTALLAITKNYDPKLLRRAAGIAIVLAFIGVFGATLQSIPACVIGGISLQLYCMIAWSGVKNIIRDRSWENAYKVFIIIVMLVIGLSGFSIQIGSVALSGLALSALVGIVLNLIGNKLIKRA